MLDFIRSAGFPIYPVLVFGLGALALAAMELKEGLGHRVRPAAWLMGVTMLSGLLGTVTGMQMSANHIGEINEKWIFLLGLSESLNNLVAATVMVIVSMLLLFGASVRRGGEPARAQAHA
jgi:mannose/fructose/N-acetylgalactosamine-specific phosphotransferase system component IID